MSAIILAAMLGVLGCAAGCAKSVRSPKLVVKQVDGPMSIEGVIQDMITNHEIPGATVIVRSPQGEHARITDSNGSFLFGDLAPGSYTLQVYAGNGTATFHISIKANTVTRIWLKVDPKSVGEVLEATGA